MTVYIQALKKFNEGKKYTIPKKGTDDYNSVMQIMRTLQSERPKKEPKAAKTKTPKQPIKAKKQKIEPIKTDTTVRG